jgi:hypothetical protein
MKWTFKREAEWMMWLALIPVAGILWVVLSAILRQTFG